MAADRHGNKTCRALECERIHVYQNLSNGSRIYSSYCQEHTCQAPRNERVPFCINPRDPTNRYCAFHGKCRARECRNQASRADKIPFPYICPHHRCTKCTSLRFGNFRVCEAHLVCQVNGCDRHPDLDHPRLLCRNHSCAMVPRCPHQAIGVTHGVSHCPHHLPCGVVRGCQRLRVRLPDGRQLAHCDEHVMCHGPGCRFLARPGMRFCPAHKCSFEGCPTEKDAHSHYCQRHTCFHGGCTQAIYHIDSGAARFCSSHECSIETCPAEAKTTHGYCDMHGCAHGSCNAVRKGSAHFCSDHRCRSEDCRHEATHRKGYCQRHVCEKKDCRHARLDGRKRIPVCLDHWSAQVRREAESSVGYEADRRAADLEERLREYQWRDQKRKALELEEEERAMEAQLEEEKRRQIRAEAERLRVAEESQRVHEEMMRAEEEERILQAAARMVEDEARERRRADRERQRRQEEAERVAHERAEQRRARERQEREREADRRWAEEARRQRERQEQDARMRDRLTPVNEYRHVPAGRRGMRRDSLHEWAL